MPIMPPPGLTQHPKSILKNLRWLCRGHFVSIDLTRLLFLTGLVAGIAMPGEAAYAGAYVALGVGALALIFGAWPERRALRHPVSLAIVGAIALVTLTVPFVYRGDRDLLGPLFILPMLTTLGMGLMANSTHKLPNPTIFGLICLVAAATAFFAGAYEYFMLGAGRVGLYNNPIHYASLAAMTGGLALVGVAATNAAWRYLFLSGPVFGLGATILSGSRGPLVGAVALFGVGIAFLLVWHWRERAFRFAVLGALLAAGACMIYLLNIGSDRIGRIIDTAFNIFRFTGSSDDIRAALYGSATDILARSPIFGVGYGQVISTAQELYPNVPAISALDHLHADWANFAAMSGGLGLVAWVLLLCAPFLLLLDRTARSDRAIVIGTFLLVTGQLVLGVSNSMFGILPQTVLYAVALGYFFARARQLSESGGISS
jgi:O-antigen ligase